MEGDCSRVAPPGRRGLTGCCHTPRGRAQACRLGRAALARSLRPHLWKLFRPRLGLHPEPGIRDPCSRPCERQLQGLIYTRVHTRLLHQGFCLSWDVALCTGASSEGAVWSGQDPSLGEGRRGCGGQRVMGPWQWVPLM